VIEAQRQSAADRGPSEVVLLDVAGLTVRFPSPDGEVHAVEDVSFQVRRGESIGIVGESGSGKTVTCMSLTWLLPSPPTRYVTGRIRFDGKDLRRGDERSLRAVRGRRVAVIFQNARAALDPSYRIGSQIAEMLALQQRLRWADARPRVIDTLRRCNIADAEGVLERYPHQVSGGVAQRVAIAMALLARPDLVIADEPTTALDLLSQLEVLMLLEQIRDEVGCSIILVSHDLAVVRRIADQVLIMYGGRIVERGSTEEIFRDPRHPYTRALLASSEQRMQGDRLYELPGHTPDLAHLPPGCAFAARCAFAFDRCRTELPDEFAITPGRSARCFLSEAGHG